MSIPLKAGAVLFAKNVDAMARFYEQVAGLGVGHRERGLVVLESSDFQLVIHGIPKTIAASINVSSPPVRRDNTALKLIVPVADIERARLQAGGLGGGVDPKNKEFTARGFRACDGFDPEGNVVQFRAVAS